MRNLTHAPSFRAPYQGTGAGSARNLTHAVISSAARNLSQTVISSAARNLALPILFLAFTPNTLAADDLGRLFTTPQQRNALEKLRSQKPVEEIKIPDITFAEPVIEEQKPVIGGITVNGLVYRKGGKSTAWVNSANTFEGNFGNQYIQIDANNIKPDDVEIVIPINEKNIKLKTGQTYDPEADQIISPGYQDN